MSVKLPEFVTQELLEKILSENYKDEASKNFKVDNFWGEWATKRGDNYASDMYRVHVDFTHDQINKRKSFLLKVMPSGKIQEIIMIKNNLYGREIEAYSVIISSIENLLAEIGDETKLTPKCFHTDYQPRPYLVFQDMTTKGYRSLPRQKFLKFDLALPVIVKLAKLHAASAVLFDRNPSIMDLYKEGCISKNPDRQDFLVHYRNCAFTLGDVAEKEWGNEWNEIAGKLKNLSKKIVQIAQEDVYIRDEDGFNVFNHNDLWVPNILFKIDENEIPQDVLFVDFQMPYFSSPAIDLNFFFYGSLSECARGAFLKKLIRIYHENLSETLQKLNYSKKIPTLHEIHMELLKKGFQCVISALGVTPLLVYPDQEHLYMDKLLENSEEAQKFRYKLFNSAAYKNYIQKLLVEFDDLGFLD